ncbi:MAG: COX15/CtaA family protein [Gilvibacter sp.]
MYRKSVKVALVLVYLVIVAGAMVRMTGSGMGCPDWPKCFGYYIPPTDIQELTWEEDREFNKGQVIIIEETLQVAKSDFTTGISYNADNWEAYTEHDYAKFNVWHTWIEYVNRLLGALSGLAILIMAILSIWQWKRRKKITIVSILSVFLIGFQGWLGAVVVYSELAPIKITIHMIMALVIVAVLLYLLYLSQENYTRQETDLPFKSVLVLALLLSLIQIILGTQVRQFVDDAIAQVGYENKSEWLANPTLLFYIHRSFSVAVTLVMFFIWYRSRLKKYQLWGVTPMLVLVLAEALTGIAMYYFDFPFLSQPLHLVFASLLFGVQFYLILQVFVRQKPVELS